MKPLGKENIENVLQALDRQIGLIGNNYICLLVCGGSALLATGLNDRTTKDVDAIGIIENVGDKKLLKKRYQSYRFGLNKPLKRWAMSMDLGSIG